MMRNKYFHSGSRKTELVRLKVWDVNLEKQEFKLLIKKGNQQREVLRPIKNFILDFTVITLKHYLVYEEERKMAKLGKVNNKFA